MALFKNPFVVLLFLVGITIVGTILFVDFPGIAEREPSMSTGVLSGKVTIGPICPVSREDMPCPIPPEVYTSREIIVYKNNGRTVEARQHLESSGHYRFELAPGGYVVDIGKSGIDSSKDVPREVIIESGKTTELNIDIDTGIR